MRLQLFYTMADLVEMIGQDPRTIRRWLRSNGVRISKIGRRYIVWLCDLVSAIPEVERSIANAIPVEQNNGQHRSASRSK